MPNADALRDIFRRDELSLSFISYHTEIDHRRLSAFFSGDDAALNGDEHDSVADLLFPSDKDQSSNFVTNNAVVDGMGHSLQCHSVAFICQGRRGEPELASGTLVQIGDSVIVATAGHVVRRTKILQFVGDNTAVFGVETGPDGAITNVSGGSNLDVFRWGKHGEYDVGFFELAAGASAQLGRDPIELERIAVRPGQYGRMTFVYGYPKQIARPLIHRRGRFGAIPLGSITYEQPLLGPYEWPNVPLCARPTDTDVDCFLRYSVSDEMITIEPAGERRFPLPADLRENLPDAEGMSGGGFWQNRKPKDALWDPSSYELVAIQSAWSRSKEYLRAIQARHWLDLVRCKCPELEVLVEEHVSRQRNCV